jgi:uncharacterized protein YpiB (UPF0302 family)
MNSTITWEEKVNFIDWFIKNHQFKKDGCLIFLKYLRGHKEIIENITFVNENDNYDIYMLISEKNVNTIPIGYIERNGCYLTDTREIYRKLLENKGKNVFLEINYENKYICPEYAVVKEIKKNEKLNEETFNEAEILLKQFIILKEIDKTLDKKDKILFDKLTNELNKLTKNCL